MAAELATNPTSASPPPSHCAVNQLTRSAAWKVRPAMQLIGQNGAQDRANCVGDQRSVTAQRQKSGKVQDVAGSADEGKTNELSKGAVAGKGAKPRCRETCTPRTHHRDRIAPDPDVRRAHIGFSHTDQSEPHVPLSNIALTESIIPLSTGRL